MPSYDKDMLNSGIIAQAFDDRKKQIIGYIVSPGFVAKYNSLIESYGNFFVPVLRPDNGVSLYEQSKGEYFIDCEHMVYFLDMNSWRMDGRLPDHNIIRSIKEGVGL
jgi:hypothetical protein